MLGNIGNIIADCKWAGDLRTFHLIRTRKPNHPERGVLPRPISIRFAGEKHKIFVRPGTLDIEIARLILTEHSEYKIPHFCHPKIIFDIGANIGCTSMYYATRYPEAKIFAFEPLPSNLDLLKANLEPFGDRVTIIPAGLGAEAGTFEYHPSNDPTNFGGGTFHNTGCDQSKTLQLPIVTPTSVLEEYGIDQIDLIKIDTEGAEYEILNALPEHIIDRAETIIGELHGISDFETLQKLSETHHIEISKRLRQKCFPFLAVRRQKTNSSLQSHSIAA